MAIGTDAAEVYTNRTITAVADYLARGGNPTAIDTTEWKTQQLAALLRLEG